MDDHLKKYRKKKNDRKIGLDRASASTKKKGEKWEKKGEREREKNKKEKKRVCAETFYRKLPNSARKLSR